MTWRGIARKTPGRVRRVAGVTAAALVLGACGTTPYRGVAEDVAAPVFPAPTTTVPPPASTTTTAPPASTTTGAPSTTTTAPPSTTTAAPSTTAAASAVVAVPGTALVVAVPAGWHVAASGGPGDAALADLARRALGVIAPSGVVDGARVVLVRDDAAGAAVPSAIVAVTPRAGGSTAAATLAAARSARAGALGASVQAPEDRVLGGGSYVTYRGTVDLDGRSVAAVSEHDTFDLGDSVLWMLFTTSEARAAADGVAFGRILLSLRAG